MTLNRDAAFRLKVNVDGANQITAFNRNLKGLETTAQLSKAQLGQMNIQINRMAREAGNTTAGIRQHIAALTTLRDRVDLNSKAYQRLGNEIDQLQAKLRAASGAAGGSAATGGGFLQGILALSGKIAAITATAAGVGYLTKQIADTGIAAVESQRRLDLLSRGFDDFARVQDSANAAASKFGLTQTEANQQFAQIYARLRPVGLTLAEITSVYNGFNTAAKLSGTTAEEASAAFLQLSQGLGTGVLRGEELNSVFEQTPAVVQAIAQEMGVGIGQIRDLAKEGKITSDIVLAALQRIERDGANKLAEALKGPAQQMKNLANSVNNLQVAISDLALPAFVGIIGNLTDKANDAVTIVNNLGDAWRYVSSQLGFVSAGLQNVINFLKITPPGLFFQGIQSFLPNLRRVTVGLAARQRQAEQNAFVGPRAPEFYGPGGAPAAPTVPRPRAVAAGGGGDSAADAAKRAQEEARRRREQLGAAQEAYRASAAELRVLRELDPIRQIQLKYAEERRAAEYKASEEVRKALSIEQQAYIQRKLSVDLKALEVRQLKELKAQYAELGDQNYEAVLASIQFNESLQNQSTVFAGIKDGLNTYIQQIRTMREAIADLSLNAFTGLEKVIGDLVTTGSANFREFARSILEATSRMIIQQLVLRSVMQAVGFLLPGGSDPFSKVAGALSGKGALSAGKLTPGGIFAMGGVLGRNGIMPFARGGIVNRPTVFPFANGIGLMGEAGPEAIMPLKRGPGGRLGVEAAGGANMGNITVNVDASGTSVQGDAPNSNKLGEALGAAVRAELVKQRRPGGLLA
jgi:lambda family phage tail tape measure protein